MPMERSSTSIHSSCVNAFPPLFPALQYPHGHLDGVELSDADRRSVPVFLHILIVQLHDAPDTAAKQPVKFSGIFLVYGMFFSPEVENSAS